MNTRPESFKLSLPVLNDDGSLAKPNVSHSHEAHSAEHSAQPELSPGAYDKQYWFSMEEKVKGAGAHNPFDGEFPPGATTLDPVARRDFVKLLGASMALAGVGSACVSPPSEKVLPYHKNPEDLTVGNSLHYATASTVAGVGTALLVTAREGRPVKIEGNPDDATSKGNTGVFEQAEVIGLYDPERAKQLKRNGRPYSKKELQDDVQRMVEKLGKKDRGAGVRFFTEPIGSPLLDELKAAVLAKLPAAKFISYSALSRQNVHDGAKLAFGKAADVSYNVEKARVIVSLDADFLYPHGAGLRYAREFAEHREGAEMNRLYVVEPSLTITGTVADHRMRLKGSAVESFARALAAKLGIGSGTLSGDAQHFVEALANDLKAAGAGALVVVGERQSAAVHALAHAIHATLGAMTVSVGEPLAADSQSDAGSLVALTNDLKAGKVDALVITARNPVFSGYADVKLADAFGKTDVFYLSTHEDETAKHATWFLPKRHWLESWGDVRSATGSVLLQQPLLEPLHPGYSEPELLSMFAGNVEPSGLALLKESWAKKGYADTEWERALQVGFIAPKTDAAPAAAVAAPAVNNDAVLAAKASNAIAGIELNLVRDYKLLDGRGAYSSWLLELPDPVTKVVWENAALFSPATAGKLGLERGDRVKLSVRSQSLDLPVYVLPGHADDAVTVSLGWGQAHIAAGQVGVNAYAVRFSDAPHFVEAKVEKTGSGYRLVSTQENWDMHKRDVALETEKERLPWYAEHKLEHLKGLQPTLQDPVDYLKEDYRWGMAVDLSRCIGCQACMIACQAENNIPVVGKESVWRNREMYWIRIDRYFSGDVNEPGVITQPVTCQQCETAPCEYVCPVNATVHSDEGLNDMIYNRCIGTRYCSNNCPYKVRRFNYFNYRKDMQPVERLGMNPDVTVRARGVMEKCTFCVQRIERGRINARRDNRKLKDQEVRTACQQVCPTEAITFGSLNDADAKVTQLHASDRSYDLLHELGTRPRNRYLVRVKNSNPALVKAHGEEKEHG